MLARRSSEQGLTKIIGTPPCHCECRRVPRDGVGRGGIQLVLDEPLLVKFAVVPCHPP